MTIQVVFKIDKKLKQAAQKRAQTEGISLSDLYQSATRSFVAGQLTVGLISRPQANLDEAIRVYQEEKKHGKLKKLRSLRSLW